jgi:hypothetical protein
MSKITLSDKNINSPAPLLYRKFENAYFIVISPAIATTIMGWGFEDLLVNRMLLISGIVGAIIKGLGMILANGQTYEKK